MSKIETIAALEALYDTASGSSVQKVFDYITPKYRDWISASRFVVLTTVGPEGTDSSPRGDIGPVVQIADDKTLVLPDWRGNNRLDSLRNIVADGRVSLMFMVTGSTTVVRVNGHAIVSTDPELLGGFEQQGKQPKTVIVMTVGEVYFQCAKAIIRSALWVGEDLSGQVPSAGDFIKEFNADLDAKGYDEGYGAYAKERMW
ncbi:MAG: pyridoxamine 5'-phosphate oxidase family protein [Pseudomonadota bacterium]